MAKPPSTPHPGKSPASGNGPSIVTFQDVELTLPSDGGPVHILRGISFSAQPAERVGIVGPSGSGKTTMLMLMAGLERCGQGHVTVSGRDLALMDEDGLAQFRSRSVGIVFQNFHLMPTMTALENVALPLEIRGDVGDATARAQEELEAVGLGKRLLHFPSQLSGGEQQRVAIARALVTGPELLIADEPTGNLDQGTGDRVIDVMFERTRKLGACVILVTHNSELAARCDRVVSMRDGKLAA